MVFEAEEATLGTVLALVATTSGKVAGEAAGEIATDCTLVFLVGSFSPCALSELTLAVKAAFSFCASISYYFMVLTVVFKSLIFSVLLASSF